MLYRVNSVKIADSSYLSESDDEGLFEIELCVANNNDDEEVVITLLMDETELSMTNDAINEAIQERRDARI